MEYRTQCRAEENHHMVMGETDWAETQKVNENGPTKQEVTNQEEEGIAEDSMMTKMNRGRVDTE